MGKLILGLGLVFLFGCGGEGGGEMMMEPPTDAAIVPTADLYWQVGSFPARRVRNRPEYTCREDSTNGLFVNINGPDFNLGITAYRSGMCSVAANENSTSYYSSGHCTGTVPGDNCVIQGPTGRYNDYRDGSRIVFTVFCFDLDGQNLHNPEGSPMEATFTIDDC